MESVTILVAEPDTDDYNNPTWDWGDPDETGAEGFYEPTDATEDGTGQAEREAGKLYLPAGTEVPAGARVLMRGRLWEVVAPPEVWGGFPGGVVARLVAIQGSDAEVGS